jgi:hypothetical protein
MAAAAQIGHVGKFGNVSRGVVGVLRQRTMAGFAGDVGVFAGGAGSGLFVVAHRAGILPGKGDGVAANEFERARSVMAVFSECFGDNGATYDQKDRQCGQQNHGRPYQMG